MPILMTVTKGRVPVHIWTTDVDAGAIDQLTNVSMLPILAGPVVAMPDVHVGIGATVGSVIPTVKAVIPASVGVDIGCGMAAVQLSVRAEDLPDGLAPVRRAIEAAVPVGFGMHDLDDAPTAAIQHLATGRAALLEKYPVIGTLQKSQSIWMRQMGTLGATISSSCVWMRRAVSGSCSTPVAVGSVM